jgi:hypothetical protein
MIGLASRNNPLLGYQRARVKSAASLDALNISAKQLEQEMMSRKMEGMTRLSALVARSFDDPDDMEREVLKIAYDHNIGDEIDPILKGIEQKRQYKQRMDSLGRVMKSAADTGMVPDSIGISASGHQTMTFTNPNAPGARGLSYEERLSLEETRQDALTNREMMRHQNRLQMVDEARQWDRLKYLDQRKAKLYLAELDAMARNTFSSSKLEEGIQKLWDKYGMDDDGIQEPAGNRPDPDESAPVQIMAPAPGIRKFNPATGRVE